MANHWNYCHPWDDTLEAFIENNAALILEASRILAVNPDRQGAAIFAATRYLMRYPDKVRDKVGNDPECQQRYWFKAMLQNAVQHDGKEARYANPLCQVSEESWLDAVAENTPDHAVLVAEWVTLQQEMDEAKLTRREREVYVLIKVYGMSRQEAADKLGIRKTRVQTLWNSANRKIDEIRMENQHVFES